MFLPEPGGSGETPRMGLFGSGPLEPGARAPDVRLQNQNGDTVQLAELFANRHLVLFFYPKDDTPVCTQEACMFRDNYDGIQQANAAVYGISSDSVDSHRAFAERHRMPFDLLSDPHGEARKAFRVPSTMGVLPGRVTFVIERGGTILSVTNSQLSAKKHVDEALAALAAI